MSYLKKEILASHREDHRPSLDSGSSEARAMSKSFHTKESVYSKVKSGMRFRAPPSKADS